MDAKDEAYFKKLVGSQVINIEQVQKRCIELYRQAILENVYLYYNPKVYSPTDQLLNAISVKVDGNTILVYSDTSMMHYTSMVSGEPVQEFIPYWIQQGHDDGIGEAQPGYNQWHRYEGRHFLEKAQALIKREFPSLKIRIINDSI
jgi:hypothetical protein